MDRKWITCGNCGASRGSVTNGGTGGCPCILRAKPTKDGFPVDYWDPPDKPRQAF